MKTLEEIYVSMEREEYPVPNEEGLMDLALESLASDITRGLGLISALQINAQQLNTEEVSLEAYQRYQSSTEAIIDASGLSIPVSLLAPEFHSFEASKLDRAKEIGANIFKFVIEQLKKLATWLGLRKEKRVKEVSKVKADLENALNEFNKLAEKKLHTYEFEVRTLGFSESELEKEISAIDNLISVVVSARGSDTYKKGNLTDNANGVISSSVILSITENDISRRVPIKLSAGQIPKNIKSVIDIAESLAKSYDLTNKRTDKALKDFQRQLERLQSQGAGKGDQLRTQEMNERIAVLNKCTKQLDLIYSSCLRLMRDAAASIEEGIVEYKKQNTKQVVK